MTTPGEERISLSKEQLDDLLKNWKRKGADRAFAFVFFASLPLAIVGGLLSDASPGQVIVACSTYYCAVVALAIFTL